MLMSPPRSPKGYENRADESKPQRHRATTRERDLLELSRRHLTSIKKEMESGTPVATGLVNELEQGIADLESAYNEDVNDRRV